MDAQIVYPGAIPQDTDILAPQRNTQVAIGYALQMLCGSPTVMTANGAVADGLTCQPTSTPSTSVLISPGSLVVAGTVDTVANGLGSLPYDGTDPLVKMGINLAYTQINFLSAIQALAAGMSQAILVQVAFSESETNPVVLPYYNAANPSQPYSGPSNSGAAQNTVRTQRVAVSTVAGIPTNGTLTVPNPSVGYYPLYVVVLTNGQSAITTANIFQHPAAPFIPAKTAPGQARIRLFADTTLNVAPNGSDAVGAANGSTMFPFATPNGAYDYIMKVLDVNNHNVTIQVAPGTYNTNTVFAGSPVGSASTTQVILSGPAGTDNQVFLNGGINGNGVFVRDGAVVTVQNLDVSTGGAFGVNYDTVGCGLAVAHNAVLYYNNVCFGPCGIAWTSCSNGVLHSKGNPYRIRASFAASAPYPAQAFGHLSSTNGATSTAGSPLTIATGTVPAVSDSFMSTTNAGTINAYGMTFNGTTTGGSLITGKKYNSVLGGSINIAGASTTTYLPGSVSGTTASGGVIA